MAGAGTVPPQVHQLPRIEGTDNGYKRRRHFRKFVKEGSPGHQVISATRVNRHDGGCGVEKRPGGLIAAARIAPGRGQQATKGVASCNSAARLLQRREASKGGRCEYWLWDIRVGQLRCRLGEQRQRGLIGQQDFVGAVAGGGRPGLLTGCKIIK